MPKDYERNSNDIKERDKEHSDKRKLIEDMQLVRENEREAVEQAKRDAGIYE